MNLSGTQFPHLQNGNENTHLPSQDQVIRVPSNSFLVAPISCLHSVPRLPACVPALPGLSANWACACLPPPSLLLFPSSPPILGQCTQRQQGWAWGGRGGAREGASCRTFQEPKPIPSGCWQLRAAGDPRETWPHQARGLSPLYPHPKVHSLPPRRVSLPGQEGACPL